MPTYRDTNPERAEKIWEGRNLGIPLKVLGTLWGISPERVRAIAWKENKRRREAGWSALDDRPGTQSGLLTKQKEGVTTMAANIGMVWSALADLLKALTRLANAAADQVEKESK